MPLIAKEALPYSQLIAGKVTQAPPAQTESQNDIQFIVNIVLRSVILALSAKFGEGEGNKSVLEVAQALRKQQSMNHTLGNQPPPVEIQEVATKKILFTINYKSETSGRGPMV